MKHLRTYEKLTYDEYGDICSETPVFYPVFVTTEDYNELYTEEDRLITKGTELYVTDPFEFHTDMSTLCPLNYTTEVPDELLEFVEYRNKKDIDKKLEMYNKASKYNI